MLLLSVNKQETSISIWWAVRTPPTARRPGWCLTNSRQIVNHVIIISK